MQVRVLFCSAILSSLFLLGCASYGNKQITQQETVEKIEIGKTTKADVKALLGEPAEVIFSDNGDEDWAYIYSKSTVRATSFIPVVGIVAGGADTKTSTLKVRFNKEGVVQKLGKGQTTGGGGSVFD
jgi:outer membrane protein assembly factor BamE (lipoprotein component of BamABCDE complex)